MYKNIAHCDLSAIQILTFINERHITQQFIVAFNFVEYLRDKSVPVITAAIINNRLSITPPKPLGVNKTDCHVTEKLLCPEDSHMSGNLLIVTKS